MGTTEKSRDFKFGITFGGRFASEDDANAALGQLEHYMTTELGFLEVRGGARDADKPLCPCESASECDERPSCVFL